MEEVKGTSARTLFFFPFNPVIEKSLLTSQKAHQAGAYLRFL